MMLIRELAAMVHKNAVEHGWWDEDRRLPEILALIHSEWSEALEEARAGRPLVWYMCSACEDEGPCVVDANAAMLCGFERAGKKPEGIAVELIDGCIRILDLYGYIGAEINGPDGKPATTEGLLGSYINCTFDELPEECPTLIAWLHGMTSNVLLSIEADEDVPNPIHLMGALSLAFMWVHKQGIDPLALLMEKHEYNKGRPYKHGKQF